MASKTIFALISVCVLTAIRVGARIENKLQAVTFLSKFGYFENSINVKGRSITDQDVEKAIEKFQRFAGVLKTGILDNNTLTLMNLPRCGVKDKNAYNSEAKRWKDYVLLGPKWKKKLLTYNITEYSQMGLTKSQIDNEFARAFQLWSEQTTLDFIVDTSGNPDIEIKFGKKQHGCDEPFDSNILGHAYFDGNTSHIHMNDMYKWSTDQNDKLSLFQTAAHEIGHTLGIDHTSVKDAVMYPSSVILLYGLHTDDIAAIQALYGPKRTNVTPNPPTRVPPTQFPITTIRPAEKELCSDSAIDTIFSSGRWTYVFKGDFYWVIDDEGRIDGYPRSITKDLSGLPSNIDAAFTYNDGTIYFFKGAHYWRFSSRRKDVGYPKLIRQGFPGIPDNIDAAFMLNGDWRIYFFKGSKFWAFDQNQISGVNTHYPQPISLWSGVPNNIDAAFQCTNGYTYIFKGMFYWRLHHKYYQVDTGTPPYPRPSAEWWFGCSSEHLPSPSTTIESVVDTIDATVEDGSHRNYDYNHEYDHYNHDYNYVHH